MREFRRKVARAMLAMGREGTAPTAAHAADFADAAHLTHTFVEMFGMPPTMMRGVFFAIPSPFVREGSPFLLVQGQPAKILKATKWEFDLLGRLFNFPAPRFPMKRLLLVVIAIFAALLPTLRAQYIFVTGASSVYRYDLDGSNSTEIVTGLSSPQGLAVSGSTLFVLSTGGGGSIASYNFDGTGGTTIVSSGLGSAQSVAASGSNLFVTNFVGSGNGSILKYNLNGTGGSTLVSGLTSPFGIATQGSDIFVSGNNQVTSSTAGRGPPDSPPRRAGTCSGSPPRPRTSSSR